MKKLFIFVNLIWAASAYALVPQITNVRTQELSQVLGSPSTPHVLDARSLQYDDFKRIPGAKRLPYNCTDTAIRHALPNKEQPIIVYSSGLKCPAGHYLAERLVRLGYSQVSSYSEGLVGWISAGFPVETEEF